LKTKKQVVVFNILIIAALFIIGADWANERIRILFHSYFADIAIPFGYYMLLFLVEDQYKPFQKWYTKALAIFLLCSQSQKRYNISVFMHSPVSLTL
jgi:hypothetical protein